MNILFYYPSNSTTVSITSVMIALKQKGHNIQLLTLSEEGDLHKEMKMLGIRSSVFNPEKKNTLSFYFKHIQFLIRFVRKNKIDLVFSHLQTANFFSAFATYFSKSRFVLCRHHSDYVYNGSNRSEKIFDKIINMFGKEFISPSKKVYDQMVNVEKVNPKKIHLINYAYDFDLFPKPDKLNAEQIKIQTGGNLVLITIGRLIHLKRHIRLFKSVAGLTKIGYDIKLHVLGDGPLKNELNSFIQENDLETIIIMHGQKINIFDYMAASDLLVHVSESEASNGVVKEASLVDLPVLVCENVGDFDEYVTSDNAITIPKDFTDEELQAKIIFVYNNKSYLKSIGSKLKQSVYEQFNINRVISQYELFLH